MEGIPHPEKVLAPGLQKANEADIETLITLEKEVSDTHTYSAMLEEADWKEEMKNGEVFLIRDGDIVVGSLSYELKNPDHLYVSGIVVSPRFQGRGYGRAALSQLLSMFTHVGRVDLVTHPDNPALKLYESLGFKVESRVENYWGEGEPRLVLALVR